MAAQCRDTGRVLRIKDTVSASKYLMQDKILCETMELDGDPVGLMMMDLPKKAKGTLKRLVLLISPLARNTQPSGFNFTELLEPLKKLEELCVCAPKSFCVAPWFSCDPNIEPLLAKVTYMKLSLNEFSPQCLRSIFFQTPKLEELESFGRFKLNRWKQSYFEGYLGISFVVTSKPGEGFRAELKNPCSDFRRHMQAVANSPPPRLLKLKRLDLYDSRIGSYTDLPESERQKIMGASSDDAAEEHDATEEHDAEKSETDTDDDISEKNDDGDMDYTSEEDGDFDADENHDDDGNQLELSEDDEEEEEKEEEDGEDRDVTGKKGKGDLSTGGTNKFEHVLDTRQLGDILATDFENEVTPNVASSLAQDNGDLLNTDFQVECAVLDNSDAEDNIPTTINCSEHDTTFMLHTGLSSPKIIEGLSTESICPDTSGKTPISDNPMLPMTPVTSGTLTGDVIFNFNELLLEEDETDEVVNVHDTTRSQHDEHRFLILPDDEEIV